MSNTACLTDIPFSLTGDTSFSGQDFVFQLGFDSPADQDTVKAFEWYLDGNLLINQNTPQLEGAVVCGNHTVAARILTAESWSGLKSLAFTTCFVDIGLDYVLAEQAVPFVDVNMQIKDQVTGAIIKDLFSAGSGSTSLNTLHRFSVQVYAVFSSALPGAVIYLRVTKNGAVVFEDTKPAVALNPGPDSSILYVDTPQSTDHYELFAASYSDATINYTLAEQLDPFVDANLQIKSGDTILAEVVFSGSGSVTAPYDEQLTFTASVGIESTGINPIMNLVVKRNGAPISDESAQAHIGDTLTYMEAAPLPGATYELIVTTSSD